MKQLRDAATSNEEHAAVNNLAASAIQGVFRRFVDGKNIQRGKQVAANEEVLLLVSAREEIEEEKYRCFHRLRISADRHGTLPAAVQSVRYSMAGQGFAQDAYTVGQPPFELRLGPCWGRP